MIKNITLGQYFPGTSIIHKLDPRMKLIITTAMIVLIFLANTFWEYISVFSLIAVAIILSGVNFKYILKGLKPLWFIILFTFVLNSFFYNGETIIFEWQFLKLTQEGLMQAVYLALRLVFLITVTTVLTLTTSPIELTDAIERLLKPLKYIKFPVHELAMMMSIAIRFIPTLLEETDKIMKAQTARGAQFDSGNIFKRAVNMVPLLVPLFVSAFRRADELALAMESRCYKGGEGRTRMKILSLKSRDFMAAVIVAGIIVFTAFDI